MDLVKQANGTLVGVGIAIEKGFQEGGTILRNMGVRVETLSIIESMDANTNKIYFKDIQD